MALAAVDRDLIKSDHGPIPADARWITVHPNGSGSKGQAVLVVPVGDGTHRVIGGAGGKLNMMKLRGVKSEEHYRAEASEKAKAKRQERKDQITADKAAGTYAEKQKHIGEVKDQRRKAQRKFIETVAASLGWDDDQLAFDPGRLSPEVAKKGKPSTMCTF